MTTRSEQAVERQTPESSGPVQPDLFGGGSVVQRAAERSRRQKLRLLLEGLPAEEQRALRAFVKHEPDIDLSLLLMRARKERRINRQVAIYLEDCARADRQRERARQLDREAEERRREAARARTEAGGLDQDERQARLEHARSLEREADQLESRAADMWRVARADDGRAQQILDKADANLQEVLVAIRDGQVDKHTRVLVELVDGHGVVEPGQDRPVGSMWAGDPTQNTGRVSTPYDEEFRPQAQGEDSGERGQE